jgi:hypothetical protein
MKKLLGFLLLLWPALLLAQAPEYTSANYAAAGDTFYFSQATPLNLPDFDQAGADFSWDFSQLGTPLTQRRLLFKPANQSGYSFLEFPYVHLPGNVNLGTTDGDTLSLAGFVTLTDVNDFFHKNSSRVEQRATAYSLNVGGLPVPLRIIYSNADVLYRFPVRYQAPDSSTSSYTTQLPGLYYIHRWQKRVNRPEAWGTLTTPYGTFDCLKLRVDLRRYDSLAVSGVGLPADTISLREYVWLSPAHKQPVLRIVQARIGGNYVTQQVEYLDSRRCLTPTAAFGYLPLSPTNGEEVQFQNLSLNADSFTWDFADGNTSNARHPRHTFADQGTYDVTLTVRTCEATETFSLPVVVRFPSSRHGAGGHASQVVNPVLDHTLELRLSQPATLHLRDMLGREVYGATLLAGTHKLQLPPQLRGCYLMELRGPEGTLLSQRLLLP